MLYEKYRPKKFSDVIGQGATADILKLQVKNNTPAHTYLFEGNRGSGKTTTARILAKALNCKSSVDGEPCGECETCKSIENGTSMDVIEIDAASNNGVDQVREIISNMRYAPTDGKYKIYIIDEVHMLSKQAFNAFLKTLEEPPKYGIFILCTTEASSLPITIISRCQKYNFKHISQLDIVSRLIFIADKEGYNPIEKAKILDLIAKMSDGAIRDGISIIEQLISGNINTYDDVIKLLGVVSNEAIFKILAYLLKGDSGKAIELVNNSLAEGVDAEKYISNIIRIVRDILMIKAGASTSNIKLIESDLKLATGASKVLSNEVLFYMIDTLQKAFADVKNSAFKGVIIEMAIVRIADFIKNNQKSNVTTNLQSLSSSVPTQEIDIESIKASLRDEIRKEISADIKKAAKEEVTNDLMKKFEQAKNILIKRAISEKEKELKEKIRIEVMAELQKSQETLKSEDLERKKQEEFKAKITACKSALIAYCNKLGESNAIFINLAEAFNKSGFVKQYGENAIYICATGKYLDIISKSFNNKTLYNNFKHYFMIDNVEYELTLD